VLSVNMTYDLVLERGVRTKGASLWTRSGAEKERPYCESSSLDVDLENVDSIFLSDGRVVKVFWATDVFGPEGDVSLLMAEGVRDLALIETFEGQVLIAKSEPTLDDRIGVSIVNEENKTLFTGVGDLIEIDLTEREYQGPQPGYQGRQFLAYLEDTYQWRQSSPSGCAHTNKYIRKDPGPVQGAPRPPQQPPPQPPPDGGPEPPPDAGPR